MMEKTGHIAQPVIASSSVFSSLARRKGRLWQRRQHLSLLRLYRLQGTRTNAESVQNTGCDLRGGDESLQHTGLERRVGDDQSNVGIAVAESAVLGILRGGVSVSGAIRRLHNDVGGAAIYRRIIEFESQFGAPHHFVDEQRNRIGVQVVGNLLAGGVLSLQPDQGDVIVLHETARARR